MDVSSPQIHMGAGIQTQLRVSLLGVQVHLHLTDRVKTAAVLSLLTLIK